MKIRCSLALNTHTDMGHRRGGMLISTGLGWASGPWLRQPGAVQMPMIGQHERYTHKIISPPNDVSTFPLPRPLPNNLFRKLIN